MHITCSTGAQTSKIVQASMHNICLNDGFIKEDSCKLAFIRSNRFDFHIQQIRTNKLRLTRFSDIIYKSFSIGPNFVSLLTNCFVFHIQQIRTNK